MGGVRKSFQGLECQFLGVVEQQDKHSKQDISSPDGFSFIWSRLSRSNRMWWVHFRQLSLDKSEKSTPIVLFARLCTRLI